MIIENGEQIIGYQYLHGTNSNASGYLIRGTIDKSKRGIFKGKTIFRQLRWGCPNLEVKNEYEK